MTASSHASPTSAVTVAAHRLAALAERRDSVSGRFFTREASAIAACARRLADRFFEGGRLLVAGAGPQTADALHVAVEFVHPALPGCRALPALALGADATATSALEARHADGAVARQVELLGRPGDVLLVIADAPPPPAIAQALGAARRRGIDTVAIVAGTAEDGADTELAAEVLRIPSTDPLIGQEIQLATYHMLWELVHIVLNHRGIPAPSDPRHGAADPGERGRCVTCADELLEAVVLAVGADGGTASVRIDGRPAEIAVELVDGVVPGDRLLVHGGAALQRVTPEGPLPAAGPDAFSALLYPMLRAQPSVAAGVVADLAAAPVEKSAETYRLRHRLLDDHAGDLATVAALLIERARRGGRVLACGNGGSATTAADLCADLLAPPPPHRGMPAVCLSSDIAVVTAVANDVGVDEIFSRQLIALGRTDDVLVLISTSGGSENLLRAAQTGRHLGMAIVGISGYDGGRLASEAAVDHCLVARSSSVHRIQEVQTTMCHLLVELVRHHQEDASCA